MYKLLSVVIIIFFLMSTAMANGVGYVGSQTCSTCHSSKYSDWIDSGHPYKFSVIENDQAPYYPEVSINFEDSWMAELGDSTHTWADIAGVIGGYGWKARFVGTDGYIIGTAGSSFPDAGKGHNQINFYNGVKHGWVNYDASNDHKIYNYGCFKCHTTGGDTSGTWLAGVEGLGTFTEGGIGCESCHGPGSEHAAAPSTSNIDRVYEFAHLDNSIGGLDYGNGKIMTPDSTRNDVTFLCGTCHNRSYTSPINSSGGFIKHHEQWDEFLTTKHFKAGFTCATCHDPHKRVIWDGDGITKTCETCHSDKATAINHPSGEGAPTCIDCHMTYAAKSGTTRGQSGFKGDIRSHLFKIIPDTNSMFSADGSVVRDDETRPAALSPAYTCLGCHNDDPNDDIPDATIEMAAEAAANMHEPNAIVQRTNMPSEFSLKQNYPNPFNPTTKIEFQLPKKTFVNITVYNLAGQNIATLKNADMNAGTHSVQFDAQGLTSGLYFYRIETDEFTNVKRMIYLK